MFIELPVVMILFGGAVGSVMLFLIVFAALHIKYFRVQIIDSRSAFYNVWFWISIVSILGVGIYGLWGLF